MALINCPECHKEVSNKAVSCPNCGNPINMDAQIHSPKNRTNLLFEKMIKEYKEVNYKIIKRSDKSVKMFRQTRKATTITIMMYSLIFVLFLYSQFSFHYRGDYPIGLAVYVLSVLVVGLISGLISYNTGKVVIAITRAGEVEEMGNVRWKYQ